MRLWFKSPTKTLELHGLVDPLRPLYCALEMRDSLTIRPSLHHKQQSLHHLRLPDGLRRHCHRGSQYVRGHLSMLPRRLRMEQVHPRREMHRHGRLCTVHDDSKRGHGSHHAHSALTSRVEVEPYRFRPDCPDCDLYARHHVSGSTDSPRTPPKQNTTNG